MKANKRIRDLRRRPTTYRLAVRDGAAILFVTTWPMRRKERPGPDEKQKQIPGMLVARLEGKAV